MARRGPTLPMERHNPRQVRVLFQQRHEIGFQPPIDLTPRQVTFEETEHRQGLDNVPERTGLENEYFQQGGMDSRSVISSLPLYHSIYFPSANRSARRGGSPAFRIFF